MFVGLDEKRTPGCLAGDRFDPLGRGAGSGYGTSQVLRLIRLQLIEPQLAHLAKYPVVAELPKLREEWAFVCLLGAIRPDKQQGGRLRGAEKLAHQLRAVAITPLQIVEKKHERAVVGNSRCHLTQRGKGPAADFLRIKDRWRLQPRLFHRLDSLEHRNSFLRR